MDNSGKKDEMVEKIGLTFKKKDPKSPIWNNENDFVKFSVNPLLIDPYKLEMNLVVKCELKYSKKKDEMCTVNDKIYKNEEYWLIIEKISSSHFAVTKYHADNFDTKVEHGTVVLRLLKEVGGEALVAVAETCLKMKERI